MKFGVREICDVVLRAKSRQVIGKQTFEADEPVIYFDSAKTSSVEGAASTVYATGGRGNSRLIAWEGERTVTFTLEDALMSPLGFAILSGAGLVEASASEAMHVHATTTATATVATNAVTVDLTTALPEGGIISTSEKAKIYAFALDETGAIKAKLGAVTATDSSLSIVVPAMSGIKDGDVLTILVDYYVEMESGVQQLEITPDKFAGNYYLEASTLFRRQEDGVDMPAVFVVPNVKIQSAFNFAMAASGDPSTFTFTMDAFPDYTKFDAKKKVLFALQIVDAV